MGRAKDRSSILGQRLGGGTTTGGKSDLVKKLQSVHGVLKGLGQDDRPEGLDETAADLVSASILRHSDKEVRLLTACCLVDILRIYAPEAPYSQEELRDVFALITAQLRGLGTAVEPEDARAERVFYVLRSLATVKSCIILVELAQQGVDGGEEALMDFVDCLLSGVRTEHPQDVVDSVLEALAVLMDELDVIFQPLLDVILLCLLPVSRADNPKSYELAQLLLRQCFNRVHQPITQFINQVLVSGKGSGGVGDSELAEHVMALVYELHKVNPTMLLYILPKVSEQLKAEDTEVRTHAVTLLGRLFASQHADYGVQFTKDWRDLLGRFKDVAVEVRRQMVEIGAAILQRKPALRKDVQEQMQLRFMDTEWEIRRRVVHELCDVAVDSLDALTPTLLKQIGERLKDKRPQIRKDAVTGLATIYAKHVSKLWEGDVGAHPADDDLPHIRPLPAELKQKLGWIPDLVLKCYAYPDLDMKTRVLQLVDDILLPKDEEGANDRVRTAGLIAMMRHMDQHAKQGLRRILEDRRRCQLEVTRYLDIKEALRKHLDDQILCVQVQERFIVLMELMPTPDRKSTLLQKLHEWPDQKVFKLLRMVCDPRTSTADVLNARAEVMKKVGSKTALGEYLKVVTRKCGLLSCGPGMLQHTMAIAAAALREEDQGVAKHALEVLDMQSSVFPVQLEKCLPQLIQTFHATQAQEDHASEAGTVLLRVMARAKQTGAKSAALPKNLQEDLFGLCVKEGTPEQATQAVHALAAMVQQDQTVSRDLVRQLSSPTVLSAKNARLVAVMAALSACAMLFPGTFWAEAEGKVTPFLMGQILKGGGGGTAGSPRGKKGQKGHAQESSALSARLCAALRLLSNRLLVLPLGGPTETGQAAPGEPDLQALAGELLDLLFGIIESEGVAPNEAQLDLEGRADLRQEASCCVMDLMTNRHLQSLLTPQRWHTLGWVLWDDEERVRLAFMRKVCGLLVDNQVPLRFMAYLCLVGEAPEGVRKEAKGCLMAAIRKMRAAHEQRSAALTLGKSAEQSLVTPLRTPRGRGGSRAQDPSPQHQREALSTLMPEYVLPYVVHLLAHSPGCPDSLEDEGPTRRIQRCLSFLLHPLVGSLGDEADNLAFLIQILDTINASYCDALDPTNERIQVVAQAARAILTASIRNQGNLQPYPGTIFLPTPLFQRMKDIPAASSSNFASAPPAMLEGVTPLKGMTPLQQPGGPAGPPDSNGPSPILPGSAAATGGARRLGPKSRGRAAAQRASDRSFGSMPPPETPNWGSPVSAIEGHAGSRSELPSPSLGGSPGELPDGDLSEGDTPQAKRRRFLKDSPADAVRSPAASQKNARKGKAAAATAVEPASLLTPSSSEMEKENRGLQNATAKSGKRAAAEVDSQGGSPLKKPRKAAAGKDRAKAAKAPKAPSKAAASKQVTADPKVPAAPEGRARKAGAVSGGSQADDQEGQSPAKKARTTAPTEASSARGKPPPAAQEAGAQPQKVSMPTLTLASLEVDEGEGQVKAGAVASNAAGPVAAGRPTSRGKRSTAEDTDTAQAEVPEEATTGQRRKAGAPGRAAGAKAKAKGGGKAAADPVQASTAKEDPKGSEDEEAPPPAKVSVPKGAAPAGKDKGIKGQGAAKARPGAADSKAPREDSQTKPGSSKMSPNSKAAAPASPTGRSKGKNLSTRTSPRRAADRSAATVEEEQSQTEKGDAAAQPQTLVRAVGGSSRAQAVTANEDSQPAAAANRTSARPAQQGSLKSRGATAFATAAAEQAEQPPIKSPPTKIPPAKAPRKGEPPTKGPISTAPHAKAPPPKRQKAQVLEAVASNDVGSHEDEQDAPRPAPKGLAAKRPVAKSVKSKEPVRVQSPRKAKTSQLPAPPSLPPKPTMAKAQQAAGKRVPPPQENSEDSDEEELRALALRRKAGRALR